jgi:hypothetical protein
MVGDSVEHDEEADKEVVEEAKVDEEKLLDKVKKSLADYLTSVTDQCRDDSISKKAQDRDLGKKSEDKELVAKEVNEDPTEEEPTAPATMGAVDEPTEYDPIGEDFMGRIMELAGCKRMEEGDISQIEKDVADAPVAPMGTNGEGVMSEVDIDLHDIARTEDFDKLYDAISGLHGGATQIHLEDMIGDIARDHRLHWDDDIDEIMEILMDRLVADYGDGDIDTPAEPAEKMSEAEYRGRKVPLGKPMRGDVKKFKVYVKDPKTGNVKKVNFGHGGTSAKRAGQKTMKIKKSNPARRKSFRARHNCDNPGPRTKARYWSCRAW